MLTQDDLQAIGQLVEEKTTKPLQQQIGGLKLEIDTKFDAVQEQLDGIENRMLTMDRLERWETGLIDRLDHRYARR